MREIKFRAKPRNLAHEQFPKIHLKSKQDFIYGTGLYNDGTNTWLILESKNECFANLKAKIVDTNTIGQYIGLTDKNNKEVYEGDIVEVIDNYIEEECEIGHFIGIVDFNCGSFYVTNKDRTYSNYRLMDLDLKVLGNIYENPELIEECGV